MKLYNYRIFAKREWHLYSKEFDKITDAIQWYQNYGNKLEIMFNRKLQLFHGNKKVK